jgi:hypothetical protein
MNYVSATIVREGEVNVVAAVSGSGDRSCVCAACVGHLLSEPLWRLAGRAWRLADGVWLDVGVVLGWMLACCGPGVVCASH